MVCWQTGQLQTFLATFLASLGTLFPWRRNLWTFKAPLVGNDLKQSLHLADVWILVWDINFASVRNFISHLSHSNCGALLCFFLLCLFSDFVLLNLTWQILHFTIVWPHLDECFTKDFKFEYTLKHFLQTFFTLTPASSMSGPVFSGTGTGASPEAVLAGSSPAEASSTALLAEASPAVPR